MTTAVRPRPRLRGVSHRAAFISALTLAPIMIVSAPRVAPRFVIAVYALAIVGLATAAVSEFCERSLFFRAEAMPSMPGAAMHITMETRRAA